MISAKEFAMQRWRETCHLVQGLGAGGVCCDAPPPARRRSEAGASTIFPSENSIMYRIVDIEKPAALACISFSTTRIPTTAAICAGPNRAGAASDTTTASFQSYSNFASDICVEN